MAGMMDQRPDLGLGQMSMDPSSTGYATAAGPPGAQPQQAPMGPPQGMPPQGQPAPGGPAAGMQNPVEMYGMQLIQQLGGLENPQAKAAAGQYANSVAMGVAPEQAYQQAASQFGIPF